MKKAEFLKILKRRQAGTASAQEEAYLSAYYNLFEAEPDVIELLSGDEREFLKNQLKAGIKKQIALQGQNPRVRSYTLMRRIAAAAILFITVLAGISVYVIKNKLLTGSYVKNDIAPGGNKAILTLASGKKIILTNLKNGRLAQQGGTQIIKTANGQVVFNVAGTSVKTDTGYNTVSTPRGGQFKVVLPDSSQVYLDAASSISFPAAYTGKYRNVILTGQAYFEVTRNRSKPFHVFARGQMVEVLGTHFNINAYSDEGAVNTTLLEGSVRISASGRTAVLVPGDDARVFIDKNKGAVISVIKNPNADEAIAWKNGFFHFENADIQTIMRQYARWYDVNVVFEGTIPNRLFSGEIHRNLNASQALDLLNYANVHFNIDGKKIIVSP